MESMVDRRVRRSNHKFHEDCDMDRSTYENRYFKILYLSKQINDLQFCTIGNDVNLNVPDGLLQMRMLQTIVERNI